MAGKPSRRVTRREFLAGAAAAAAVPVLARYTLAAPAPTPTVIRPGRRTITVATGTDDPWLDPQTGTPQHNAIRHIYEPLVQRDSQGKLVPVLAERWQVVRPTTWRFTLRQGARFHNGEPFNAESVKFSLERVVNPDLRSAQAPFFSAIERVEIESTYSVLVHTKGPFGPLLANLSAYAEMLPASAANDDTIFKTRSIGTGPFRFAEFRQGEVWVLDANPDYWGPKPKFDRVVIRTIRDEATRLASIQSGDVDIIDVVPPDREDELRRDPNITISKSDSFTVRYHLFNNQKPPFNDIKVRQAWNHAINKTAIWENILRKRGRVATAPITPPVFGHNPNLKAYPYDSQKARQLFKEAGYASGFKVTNSCFVGNVTAADDAVRLATQAQLANYGIEVTLDCREPQAIVAHVLNNPFDFMQAGYQALSGDADFALYALFHTPPSGSNRPRYSNPDVDRLLDAARVEADQEKRAKLYWQVQEILWKDLPFAWLFHDGEVFAIRSRVKGVAARPDRKVLLHNAEVV